VKYPQLPEAEFTVMQTVWEQEAPISSSQVAELLKPARGWKHQTVYTLLTRLVEKGFLSSEKRGKERYYLPLMEREAYLRQETGRFVETFHKNSLTGLMSALVSTAHIDDADLSELTAWLKEREQGERDDV